MILTVDIETMGTTDPVIQQQIREGISAPANYKKEESIQKWMETHGEEKAQEAISKTALNGDRGSIIAIGMKRDDNPTEVAWRKPDQPEGVLIQTFFNALDTIYLLEKEMPLIVGHNVQSFDLRFIYQRAIINGIKPPHLFQSYLRRFSDRVFDTMEQWAGFGQRISLDRLSYALTGEGKNGSGGDVAGLIQEEKWTELVDYCAKDVDLTYEVYRKMNFMEAA